VYLFTGLVKLNDCFLFGGFRLEDGSAIINPDARIGDYVDGMAMYWVFNDLTLTRWPYASLPIPVILCRLMSWTTIAFELSFSFLVWIGRVRVALFGTSPTEPVINLSLPVGRLVLLLGVALHLGILLTMEIGWFSQVTLCWYVLFVPGEKVHSFIARFGARSKRCQKEAGTQTP
jgi:hypothetical protein